MYSKKRNYPISLIAVGGLLLLIGTGVALALLTSLSPTVAVSQVYHREVLERLLQNMEGEIRRLLEPVEDQAYWAMEKSREGFFDYDDERAMEVAVTGMLAATPQMIGIGFLSADTMRLTKFARDRSVADTILEQQEDLQAPELQIIQRLSQSDRPIWGNVVWSDDVTQPMLNMMTPLFDPQGTFRGVLFHAIVIGEVTEITRRIQQEEVVFTPFVLYGEDRILAHPAFMEWRVQSMYDNQEAPDTPGIERLPRIGNYIDDVLKLGMDPELPYPDLLADMPDATVRELELESGDAYYWVFRTLIGFGEIPLVLGIHFNGEEVGSKGVELIQEIFIGGLVFLVLGSIIAIKTGRRLARPIKRLAHTASIVGAGRLDNLPELPPSRIRELDDARKSFETMIEGLRERQVIRDVMGKYVPAEIATELIHGKGALEPVSREATVLFADIAGFTNLTESLGPNGIVSVLNAYFSHVVDILEKHGGVVTQFQGDAILAVFNVPVENASHAQNGLAAAREMLETVSGTSFGGHPLSIRIGLNTGPVVAGSVGAEGRLNYTVHGDAVNLAARLEGLNKEYGTCLLVAGSTMEASADNRLEHITRISVRGQTSEIDVFREGS